MEIWAARAVFELDMMGGEMQVDPKRDAVCW